MDSALCSTADSAHGAGVVPLQYVMMSSCVKETPTYDPTECIDTAMPSQPEPVLKGCATPVVLHGEEKTTQFVFILIRDSGVVLTFSSEY